MEDNSNNDKVSTTYDFVVMLSLTTTTVLLEEKKPNRSQLLFFYQGATKKSTIHSRSTTRHQNQPSTMAITLFKLPNAIWWIDNLDYNDAASCVPKSALAIVDTESTMKLRSVDA
jgi:hypothetical protein